MRGVKPSLTEGMLAEQELLEFRQERNQSLAVYTQKFEEELQKCFQLGVEVANNKVINSYPAHITESDLIDLGVMIRDLGKPDGSFPATLEIAKAKVAE